MSAQKNILLIFNDDHAQWASGTYGNQELDTPNIDHLANTGVRMDNAFTPTPVCSPARACLLTGMMASQHGIHDYLSSETAEIHDRDWLAEVTLLPEILKDHGYQTFYCGKWHLGRDHIPHPAFDQWFTLWGDYPYVHCSNNRYSDNGQDVRISGYTTRVITDKAMEFIKARDPSRPFFLMIGYNATHSPWSGHPERLVGRYRQNQFVDIPKGELYPFGEQALESTMVDRTGQEKALAQYYSSVTHHDEALGQLLDTLDGLNMREETLVVFTSDHGLNCGHHGIWGKGNGTYPLNMVEESIRVPMILSQPDMIAEGKSLDGFVDHTDLFQTLLEYSEAGLPQYREEPLPGKSFLPKLINPDLDVNFKEIQFGEYGPLRMARTDSYKLVRRYPDGPNELFDLMNDPREMNNLIDNPEYSPLITELSQKIKEFFQRYSHPEKSGLLGPELPRCNFTEAWHI